MYVKLQDIRTLKATNTFRNYGGNVEYKLVRRNGKMVQVCLTLPYIGDRIVTKNKRHMVIKTN